MTLTILGVKAVDSNNKEINGLSMTTGSGAAAGRCKLTVSYWKKDPSDTDWGSKQNEKELTFLFTLQFAEFHKQIYSPNSIEAYILIKPEDSDTDVYKAFPTRDQLNELFATRVVKLECSTKKADGSEEMKTVCDDYYVHEILPRKYADQMFVTLKIFSPDKVMTLKKYCRTFVAKRLGDEILKGEIGQFSIKRTEKDSEGKETEKATKLDYDTTGMKFIQTVAEETEKDANGNPKKDANGNEIKKKIYTEHIFPYLVQYNESFYDFLARTTNRWGEFLYYENKKLNIGYDTTEVEKNDYDVMTYCNWNDSLPAQTGEGTYVGDAPYDSNILKSVVTEDAYDKVKGTIANLTPDDFNTAGGDCYLMKKAAQVLNNSKSLKNFLFDTAVDDLFTLGLQEANVALLNKKYNDAYFVNKKTDHGSLPNHGDAHHSKNKKDKKTYNEFSEATPMVGADTYKTILEGEMKAARNVVNIEFDTNYPDLKLGQVIKVDGELFIVAEVVGYQPETAKTDAQSYYERGYDSKVVRFRVTAIAKDGNNYYPPMLPTGHVRISGPQVAVVVDEDDPIRGNRVRVKYPWQLQDFITKLDEGKDEADKIKSFEKLTAANLKDIDCADATPWLLYASSSGPAKAGVHGKHYLAEKVLVDYAGGNVERPYVVGSVSADVPPALKTGSAVMMAPNGEFIKVHEGLGNGALAFAASFTPGLKLLSSIIPYQIVPDNDISARFEGGVDIGDKFGIWSIKGSTDGRNVSISSAWGDVKINAFTGITIAAPNGDIKISGKNVTIAAGNNLTLVSGQNIKNKFISTYGEGWIYNPASFVGDVTKMVTKKLADMFISIVDLSIIRTVVEVFWKPQEGALTVKSNRFLKLEAGGASAGYPDAVYKDPKKRAIKDLKKQGTLNMGPAMATLISKVPHVVDYMVKAYSSQYRECVKRKLTFEKAVGRLQFYSKNEDNVLPVNTVVCNVYADLKNKLWDPNTKEITATDLNFRDNVKDVGGDDVVNDACRQRAAGRGRIGFHRHGLVRSVKEGDDMREFILGKRKYHKEKVLKSANELLKAIIKLRTLPLRTDDATYSALFYGAVTKYAPANYVSIFQKAFSQKALADSEFYQYAYDDNAINDARADLDPNAVIFNDLDNLKKALARRVASNMIKEWGIGKTTIQHTMNQGVWEAEDIEAAPADLQTDHDFADDLTWQLFVQSLSLTDLTVIKKDVNFVTTIGADLLNKLFFWTPALEYYSWGNAKAGQILFGTGTTYALDSSGGIQPINARYNKGKIDKSGLFDEGEQKIEKMMQPIRLALLALYAPVAQNNAGNQLIEGQHDDQQVNDQPVDEGEGLELDDLAVGDNNVENHVD